MSVLKSGELYLLSKGLLGSKKAKKYGILYGKSSESHPCMELYDSQEHFEENKKGKKVDMKKIDLSHIKSIINQTSKGKEYHLEIRTKKEKNTFMFDSESESENWNSHLKGLVNISDKHEEDSTSSAIDIGHSDDNDDDDDCVTINEMYGGAQEVQRYEVEVKDTALAKLCNIAGKHCLIVSETTLAFENQSTKKIDYTFQISWLRRFGKKEKVFSFEVGRSCPNGAGEIKCQTESAKSVHQLVQNKSSSRGETIIPAASRGIEAAQNNVKHIIESKIETRENSISGPALHKPRRHPGLGAGPALIPLNIPKKGSDDETPSPVLDRDKRSSSKSMNGDNNKSSRSSGSIKHAGASEKLTKELENVISDSHNKDSVKTKEKDRDSKKKENERKKEEKERKKLEEKKEKERREQEKKLKEKAKKDEKKLKEKPQPAIPSKPKGNVPGAYEEVDINPSASQKVEPINSDNHIDDDLYHSASSPTTEGPVEYAQPIKRPTHVPTEYSDVKTVKGNAWQSHGRSEDEEEHTEDYSKIKSVRKQLDANAPPIPDRGYDEEEDDTYNRLELKSTHLKGGRKQEPQNIYGTASETKIGPRKKSPFIPKPDYNQSDSGESYHEDAYDMPDIDTYDTPIDIKSKTPDNYEEARPTPKRQEEALYDEVS